MPRHKQVIGPDRVRLSLVVPKGLAGWLRAKALEHSRRSHYLSVNSLIVRLLMEVKEEER